MAFRCDCPLGFFLQASAKGPGNIFGASTAILSASRDLFYAYRHVASSIATGSFVRIARKERGPTLRRRPAQALGTTPSSICSIFHARADGRADGIQRCTAPRTPDGPYRIHPLQKKLVVAFRHARQPSTLATGAIRRGLHGEPFRSTTLTHPRWCAVFGLLARAPRGGKKIRKIVAANNVENNLARCPGLFYDINPDAHCPGYYEPNTAARSLRPRDPRRSSRAGNIVRDIERLNTAGDVPVSFDGFHPFKAANAPLRVIARGATGGDGLFQARLLPGRGSESLQGAKDNILHPGGRLPNLARLVAKFGGSRRAGCPAKIIALIILRANQEPAAPVPQEELRGPAP